MDTITVIMGGLRVILGFINLLFVPGFVILVVFFLSFTNLELIPRLVYSTILSIGSVIALILFIDVVLGVDRTPANISLFLGVFSAMMLVVWLCEIWYLSGSSPAKLHQKFSVNYWALPKYFSRKINSTRDRFTKTAMTVVVWHRNIKSGRNQVDHSYLIDVSEEIDIQQVDEYKWKISDDALLPPPYPRTRYFELVIREYKEDELSLINDLQVYPVQVTRKPDLTLMGHRIKCGSQKITGRIYEKTDTTEIQWIYCHNFHIFAIIHSQDNLGQIVDRVVAKLDEIAISIKSGSRVSSHVEDTQKLKDDFDIVLEKPCRIPTSTVVTARYPKSRIFAHPTEIDRRKLQADILRDLNVHHVTPDTFRKSERMINIKIPENTNINKLVASMDELKDDNWLYE